MMKRLQRIIPLFLVALFVLSMALPTSCSADTSFDISKYTDNELAEIYSAISSKLFDCIVVPQGIYVVGEDLPAGRYAILQNGDLPGDDPQYSHVAIFSNMDDYKKESNNYSWFEDDSICVDACNTIWGGINCELSDGMVIAVAFGTAGIRRHYSDLFASFWG